MPVYATRAEGHMRPNKLRQLLRDGKPSVATHLHSMWPTMVEVVGHTGLYDYIEFSGEYAPYDLFSLENFCRAVELFDLGAMIKLDQAPRSFLAQRAIGAGFQSVLFADVRTADDARECVQVVRPETPGSVGNHGVGDRRAAFMHHAGTEEYIRALNDIVIMVMVEKRETVEQLDEILAVPGIDMVQWGPGDYSMSIGKPGAWHSPEVKAVERTVLEKCLKAGVQPRAEINSPSEAAPYLEMGVTHFAIGTDVYVVYEWMKESGSALRKLVDG